MKKFLSMIMLATLMAAFAFVSCDDEGKVDDGPREDNVLSGSITGTLQLDANVEYELAGPLIVEEGGVLEIPAGTVIKAQQGFSKYILVLQGGKINARGTADKPVYMIADRDNAGEGYWGGLIINGNAPLADPAEVGSTEVNSAYVYGGSNPADNSGVITYLVLGSTGARSSADVEHNGLTLNGVGNGTKIENLYIYDGADDAIEFFGGSVNVKNLLVVNSDDDMFDFTQGYNGTLENAYGIWEVGYQSGESDPRGIEADGNLDGNFADHPNQANFTVKNMTIELKLAAVTGAEAERSTPPYKYMHDVIKLRRGANAIIENALVKGVGTAKDLVDVTDGKGAGDTRAQISLTNALENDIIGNEINAPAETSYPGIKIEAGNTGCSTNIFDWTGYEF
ncbi:MAG: hypothetical protein GX371_08475 [Bacteroidales bacterium]|nr:hypothetical protein [Bacteroidales bacterium]